MSGLFKLEWSGDGFAALNAKTYFCYNLDSNTDDKYSSKGISKSFVLTKDDYLKVLDTKTIPKQQNRGFIFRGNTMYSYQVNKEGLKYFYCKRRLLSDGFSTTYLEI